MTGIGLSATALLCLAAFLGALAQRMAGIGFALVAAPLFSLVLGPFQGVLLSNVLSLMVNSGVLAGTWRHVEWRKSLMLSVPALCAVLPGAWLARNLPDAWLLIGTGSVIVCASAILVHLDGIPGLNGVGGLAAAGAVSGFMNVIAGVGGPAMALYAASTKWAMQAFVPTLQLFNMIVNTASILTKGFPTVNVVTIALAAGALGAGVALGASLAKRMADDRTRKLALGIAVLGGVLTVVKGVLLV